MNNTKELLEDFLTYLADEGVEFNLGYHDHAADYINKKELKSDLLNPVIVSLPTDIEIEAQAEKALFGFGQGRKYDDDYCIGYEHGAKWIRG